MDDSIHWFDMVTTTLQPALDLRYNQPEDADRSHEERLDGYIWGWHRPEGWMFKEWGLKPEWSDTYTPQEAALIIQERMGPVNLGKFPEILIFWARCETLRNQPRIRVAMCRTSKGYLRGFSRNPPEWYTSATKTRWDRLSKLL